MYEVLVNFSQYAAILCFLLLRRFDRSRPVTIPCSRIVRVQVLARALFEIKMLRWVWGCCRQGCAGGSDMVHGDVDGIPLLSHPRGPLFTSGHNVNLSCLPFYPSLWGLTGQTSRSHPGKAALWGQLRVHGSPFLYAAGGLLEAYRGVLRARKNSRHVQQ